MKIRYLTVATLALAVFAGMTLQKSETARHIRQIVPEHTEPKPATPNTSRSLQTKQDSDLVSTVMIYGALGVIVIVFGFGIFSGQSDYRKFKDNPDKRYRTDPLPHPGKPGSFRMSSTPHTK